MMIGLIDYTVDGQQLKPAAPGVGGSTQR
jgi:hypothetical protein